MLIDAPATDGRELAWAAFKHDVDVYFFWHAVHWRHNTQKQGERNQNVWANPITFDDRGQPHKPLIDQGFINGDGVLMYPGEEKLHPEEDRGVPGPVSTIQLANLRRGLQDHQYLTIARARGLDAAVRQALAAIVPKVFSDAGDRVSFPEHGDPYDKVRLMLGRAIAAGAEAGVGRGCRPAAAPGDRSAGPLRHSGGRSHPGPAPGIPARQRLERRHQRPARGARLGRDRRQHRRRRAARLQPGHELRDRPGQPAAGAREDHDVSAGVGPRSVSDSRERAHRKLAVGAQRGYRRAAGRWRDARAVSAHRHRRSAPDRRRPRAWAAARVLAGKADRSGLGGVAGVDVRSDVQHHATGRMDVLWTRRDFPSSPRSCGTTRWRAVP